jgi:hypothetical protein
MDESIDTQDELTTPYLSPTQNSPRVLDVNDLGWSQKLRLAVLVVTQLFAIERPVPFIPCPQQRCKVTALLLVQITLHYVLLGSGGHVELGVGATLKRHVTR